MNATLDDQVKVGVEVETGRLQERKAAVLVALIFAEALDLPFQVRCMRLLGVWQDPQGDEPGDLWVFTSKTAPSERCQSQNLSTSMNL